MPDDNHRLFFAAEIKALWPSQFPPGKILAENFRHLTLAFLGSISLSQLLNQMKDLLLPSFQLGPSGYGTEWIFLPNPQEPRVVALACTSLPPLTEYQTHLTQGLKSLGYLRHETRPFFPHITVARGECDVEAWKSVPCQIPFYVTAITLQKSLGNSEYKTLWSHDLIPPFEEIEHTADVAFLIRGMNFSDLAHHAQLALAFQYPPLIPYLLTDLEYLSLDAVIATLNRIIGAADGEIGVPFKAVSYHAEISSQEQFLTWRMIVDV